MPRHCAALGRGQRWQDWSPARSARAGASASGRERLAVALAAPPVLVGVPPVLIRSDTLHLEPDLRAVQVGTVRDARLVARVAVRLGPRRRRRRGRGLRLGLHRGRGRGLRGRSRGGSRGDGTTHVSLFSWAGGGGACSLVGAGAGVAQSGMPQIPTCCCWALAWAASISGGGGLPGRAPVRAGLRRARQAAAVDRGAGLHARRARPLPARPGVRLHQRRQLCGARGRRRGVRRERAPQAGRGVLPGPRAVRGLTGHQDDRPHGGLTQPGQRGRSRASTSPARTWSGSRRERRAGESPGGHLHKARRQHARCRPCAGPDRGAGPG
jgi:hypothetical protein